MSQLRTVGRLDGTARAVPRASGDDLVAGLVLARDLHPALLDEGAQQRVQRLHHVVVAGNVKEEGMRRVEELGPYQIHGDDDMMQALDALLRAFVEQRRMKIAGEYKPCYELVV